MSAAGIQSWLQFRKHYWPGVWLGNGVSSVRYWTWRFFSSEGRSENKPTTPHPRDPV